MLVDAATEAGVELRENFPVHQLLREGEHVSGIRGHTKAGKAITELARIVIGADGVNSVVARAVDAETYNVRPALTRWYAAHWSGVPIDGVAFYLRNRRTIVGCYTNDGLTVVLTSCPHDEFGRFRADVEGNYYKTLELVPELAERVRAGRREERFIGTSSTANFFRKPYGPGWALVGDAGYHKDPSTAQGISDSFRDAELLTEAVDQGFSERQTLEEALAEYERQRNASVMAMYDFTVQLANIAEPPTPQMQQLLFALQGNQEQIDRLLGAWAGAVPISEFFAPESIERIVTAARR
jgi:2-polyprenyl-6-methoxyphenol hydroxylase-like FAD-dependent oxidoreductase